MGYYICTESLFFLQSDDTNCFLNEHDLKKLGPIYYKTHSNWIQISVFKEVRVRWRWRDFVIDNCPYIDGYN